MSSSPAPDRTAILVLGMHRSGTSAITWLLGALGAALPRDPIGESGDNRKGYFESRAVVAADDRLVRALRSSWFDPRALDVGRLGEEGARAHRADIRDAVLAAFGDAPLFAMKDPRQCRFVPLVSQALAEAGIAARAALVVRSAGEVAASLLARDATVVPYGALLWLRHMLDAERDTRAMPRVVVGYEAALEDWRPAAPRLAALLGQEGWHPDDGFAERVAGFLDPALRRQRAALPLPEPLAGLVAAAEAGLARLAAGDDAGCADLDGVRARLDDLAWLEGDIVHDELRHRRVPAKPPEPAPPPAAAPAAPPPPGDAETIRIVRDSGLFDEAYYRARYPDVTGDAVAHYVTVGAAEGRNPNAHFNTAYYARQMARRRGGAA